MKKEIDLWIEERKDEILAELTELVRFKSVSVYNPESTDPFGPECTAVLEKALVLAKKHGLSGRNMENMCGYARLDVNKDAKEFGLFAHLDVVPELEGWFGEPYKVLVRDGWAIGRGISDNKGAAVASMFALEYLRSHATPRHNWLLFLGLNEESGMRDLKYFLEHHSAPALSLVPDAGFPVCYAEKSHLNARIRIDISKTNILSLTAGTVVNIVPGEAEAYIALKDCYEKDPQNIASLPSRKVSAKGLSSHASMPDNGVNAIGKLADELLAGDLLNAEGRKVMELVSKLANDYHGAVAGVDRDDPELGNTSHSCDIARVEGRDLLLTFDIRFPATTKAAEIHAQLKSFYEAKGIALEVLRMDDAIPKDPHARLIDKLTEIVNEEKGTELQPYTMGGGTYARKLPNAYGFGLDSDAARPEFFPQGHGNVHQPNEAIHIDEYCQGIKILIKAILWLDAHED
ncbi:MAG: Sapep family Mn(2+)-dependent dipeptidase [Anaerolineaceae bacterium]|nr:Sapep family Mn(2+)-dependent dipeptidase [Anaerolineaceae bacterium]